jgi:hypothetical protein
MWYCRFSRGISPWLIFKPGNRLYREYPQLPLPSIANYLTYPNKAFFHLYQHMRITKVKSHT